MKKCPLCGLVNPLEGMRCDCGYDFTSRTAASLLLEKTGQRNMVIGAALIVVGLTITGFTFLFASITGFYLIAWGLVAFGIVKVIRGIVQYSRRTRV
jgi:hypothetical protein